MTEHSRYITLSELQLRIRQAIDRALPLPLWIVAEISELKVNYSGHCYLELVEKSEPAAARGRVAKGDTTQGADADGASRRALGASNAIPCAQARGVIWRNQYQMLARYFEAESGSKLAAGMKILAKVQVSYHELYGLSLQITDIDPSFTVGEVEREKQLTIKQLQEDGVWDMNRETELPTLVQRLAVVSSSAAAGYRDFCNELREGGYAFRYELFDAVVQGAAAEESVVEALSQIAERYEEFDAVVIIRGGGSASDLSCFNSYRLCSYVAQFPLPILTGIGHDKDISVADMVAHTPLKTPTAVAGWLTERMARIEGWIEEATVRLRDLAMGATSRERIELERLSGELRERSATFCERGKSKLTLWSELLCSAAQRIVEQHRQRLSIAEATIEAHSIERILRMGFAVVRSEGRALQSVESAEVGKSVEIELADGIVKGELLSIEPK